MKNFFKNISNSKKKRIILLIAVILAALTVFRIVSSNINNRPEIISDVVNVKVTDVVRATLETTAPLSGHISPVNEVSVIPQIGGQVKQVYVELGDKVAQGTVLFDLDKTQMQTAYNQANESYLNAKANLDRMSILFNEGAISKQALESVQLQYNIALQTRIMAADSLGNATVTSPIGGYVTSVNVVQGGLASQAMAAVTIADISKVEINTSVTEQLINKIKLDDKVSVMIPSVSEDPISGTITALSPAPAVGSMTYPLKVTIDNPDTRIKPGMTAEVIITAEKNTDAIVIPSNAVMIKGGKTIAAIISPDNKVILREVSVGIDNGTQAQILDGLSAGEKVVVEGQQYIDEDTEVMIVE